MSMHDKDDEPVRQLKDGETYSAEGTITFHKRKKRSTFVECVMLSLDTVKELLISGTDRCSIAVFLYMSTKVRIASPDIDVTIKEMADDLSYTRQAIMDALTNLKKGGYILSAGKGKYRVGEVTAWRGDISKWIEYNHASTETVPSHE